MCETIDTEAPPEPRPEPLSLESTSLHVPQAYRLEFAGSAESRCEGVGRRGLCAEAAVRVGRGDGASPTKLTPRAERAPLALPGAVTGRMETGSGRLSRGTAGKACFAR